MSETRHNPYRNGRALMSEHVDELLTIAHVDGTAVIEYTGSSAGAYMMTTILLDHPLSRLHDMYGAQDFAMTITPRGGFPGYEDPPEDLPEDGEVEA
jgi:hypothetical protein